MIEKLLSLDGAILLFIQEHVRNPVLNPIVIWITKLGDNGLIWILLSIILLSFKRTRKIGIISVCGLVGSFWINNQFLKNLFERVRPYDAINGLVPLIDRPGGFSFPSGHTASSFAAAYVMFQRLPKKWGMPILILALLIGLSRLYVGVHYPTDVLFGMISGILISYMAGRMVDSV